MQLIEQWNSIEVELLRWLKFAFILIMLLGGFKKSNDLISGLLFFFY